MIEVRVHDAPPEYQIDQVWVTVDAVEIHRAGGDDDLDTGGWGNLTIMDPNPFNLLDYQGGLENVLSMEKLGEGNFTQVRMTVSKVEVVTLEGNTTAKLPSGKLKFVRPFEIRGGEKTILSFDFIVERSIVFTGSGKVIFKPVIKLDVIYEAEADTTAPTVVSTPPTVVSTSPLVNATNVAITTVVSATFSEAMDEATITAGSFTLSVGGPVAGTVSYDAGTLTATFTPGANLAHSTVYTATITTAVTDAAGNALQADYAWSFTTTADTTPPTVVSTSPLDTNVAITTAVSATFSEAMDEATITAGSFTLSVGGPVAGTVSYDAVTLTATFTPIFRPNLAYNTVYTVTITTAVTDAAGNHLAADYVWSFTTEGP